jgi:hypothetical protein
MRALAALPILLSAACFNPVESDLAASLGPEAPGVEESEFHRFGQPCLACHDRGGESPHFSVAGTVFATQNEDIPVLGAKVIVIDAAGKRFDATTNCAGNFMVEPSQFEPQYPLHVEVECTLPDGSVRRSVMGTRVAREGSCAGCHDKGPPSPTSPGRVFCVTSQPDPPFTIPTPCEGGPNPQ